MKLLLTLVLLLLSYCLLVKGSDSGYIQILSYSDSNSQCKGKVPQNTKYIINGRCDPTQNQIVTCDSSSNIITTISWSDAGCTGTNIFNTTTPLNQCVNYNGLNSRISCVDNVVLPTSDALISINAPTCNWKDDFASISISPTHYCFATGFGTYLSVCNSTSSTSYIYQYGHNCNGAPFQTTSQSFDAGCNEVSQDQTITFHCL